MSPGDRFFDDLLDDLEVGICEKHRNVQGFEWRDFLDSQGRCRVCRSHFTEGGLAPPQTWFRLKLRVRRWFQHRFKRGLMPTQPWLETDVDFRTPQKPSETKEPVRTFSYGRPAPTSIPSDGQPRKS